MKAILSSPLTSVRIALAALLVLGLLSSHAASLPEASDRPQPTTPVVGSVLMAGKPIEAGCDWPSDGFGIPGGYSIVSAVVDCRLIVEDILEAPNVAASEGDLDGVKEGLEEMQGHPPECAEQTWHANMHYWSTSFADAEDRAWYDWVWWTGYVTSYDVEAGLRYDCRAGDFTFPFLCYANDAQNEPAGNYVVKSCFQYQWAMGADEPDRDGTMYCSSCDNNAVGVFGDEWDSPAAGTWTWAAEIHMSSYETPQFSCRFWMSDGFGPPKAQVATECLHRVTSKSGRQIQRDVGLTREF